MDINNSSLSSKATRWNKIGNITKFFNGLRKVTKQKT